MTDLGVPSEPPVDVYLVAKRLGLQVGEDHLPEDVSGILYQPKPQTTMIIVNKSHSVPRKRFSIAHEIGHFVLGHQTGVHVDKKILFRDEISSAAIDAAEIAANAFAAELLMPAEWIRRSYRELVQKFYNDEDEFLFTLADLYKVSRAAIGFRLKNLGLSTA